jgi:hypothetical protein
MEEVDMPDDQLLRSYERLRVAHARSGEELAEVLVRVTIARVREVLPAAEALELYGDLNEDFVPRLRIRRVLAADGSVLFDVTAGHRDRAVEDMVDEVDIEYLDALSELSPGKFVGAVELRE